MLATLSVSTESSQLWKIEEEWQEAESKSEVVTYCQFADQWNKGQVDGVEEHERLLLMACRYAKVAGEP